MAASFLTGYLNEHSDESWELVGLIPLNTLDAPKDLNCLVVHRKYFTEETPNDSG